MFCCAIILSRDNVHHVGLLRIVSYDDMIQMIPVKRDLYFAKKTPKHCPKPPDEPQPKRLGTALFLIFKKRQAYELYPL